MRAIALLPALLLAGCASEPNAPTADDSAFDLPSDQVIYEGEQVLTVGGILRSRVEADTIYSFEQNRRHEFRRSEVNFFQDNGQSAGTLTSTTAEYDVASGLFVARGDVVLVTPSPEGGERRLETEELHFDLNSDQIWSDVPSRLTENGQTTNVTRFRSDSQFKTWEASGVNTQGAAEGGIRF